jgi:type IV pilus assembly protein PilC
MTEKNENKQVEEKVIDEKKFPENEGEKKESIQKEETEKGGDKKMVDQKPDDKLQDNVNKGKNKTEENIVPLKKKKGFSKGFKLFGSRGVSDLKMAFAFRNLSIMLKSGLALEGAMKILSEQLDEKTLREVFAEILADNRNGISIADSMRKHPNLFSNLIVSLVSSGEQGATLEGNLLILADYLKKNHEMKQKVKGALVYPLVVLGITMVELLGVVYFLLPKLDTLFSTFGNLPDFTRFVMDSARFIRENTWQIFLVLVVFIFVFLKFLKTKLGKKLKDNFSLRFPVIKRLNKNKILATFSQTFAILLQNGIPITAAIKIASETNDNYVYSIALNDVRTKMEAGTGLSEAMLKYSHLFPMTYIKMIEIGEQTGSLPDTLVYIYEFYAEEAAEISNNLATLLEPILLVFIGVMIGGLAIIIIGPIYQLMSTING